MTYTIIGLTKNGVMRVYDCGAVIAPPLGEVERMCEAHDYVQVLVIENAVDNSGHTRRYEYEIAPKVREVSL